MPDFEPTGQNYELNYVRSSVDDSASGSLTNSLKCSLFRLSWRSSNSVFELFTVHQVDIFDFPGNNGSKRQQPAQDHSGVRPQCLQSCNYRVEPQSDRDEAETAKV